MFSSPHAVCLTIFKNLKFLSKLLFVKIANQEKGMGGWEGGGGGGGERCSCKVWLCRLLSLPVLLHGICVVFLRNISLSPAHFPPTPNTHMHTPQDFCATVQRAAQHKIWGLLINSFPRIEVPYCKHKAPSTDIFYDELEPLKRRI